MDKYTDNRIIKDTIKRLEMLNDEKFTYMLADVLMHRIHDEGIVPAIMVEGKPFVFTDKHNQKWYSMFTDDKEVQLCPEQADGDIQDVLIKDLLKMAFEAQDIKGVIINPYGQKRKLFDDTLGMIFMVYEKEYGKL